MKLEEIRKQWRNPPQEPGAAVALWNSQADDPTYHRMPTFKNNAFLQLLLRERMVEPDFTTLDLGCGCGVYTIALAGCVRRAVGIDISPRMLENGNKLIKDGHLANAELRQADWNTVDADAEGLREGFDLVFTHTSPAVSDAASLEKLISASRGFCAVCNPTHMGEPVLEDLPLLIGQSESDNFCRSSIIYMLDMLLQLGYLPKLDYEKQVWPMDQPLEQAYRYYLGRLSMGTPLEADAEKAVRERLASIAVEGHVKDNIDATVTTVYWEK